MGSLSTKDLMNFWRPLVDDAGHSWSIGTFGASAEFHREPDEAVAKSDTATTMSVATDKGAIRVDAKGALEVVAFDNLNSDGESWSQSVAFCNAFRADAPQVITPLGEDRDAIRDADRSARLYDLGVGLGLVRFCARTPDAALIAELDKAAGKALFGPDMGDLMHAFYRAQPHRVMISPAARIEVFQNIPPPDGNSPEGPHTHLLPKLVARGWTHSANTPLPDGLQSVLNLHPRSPWRDGLGKRVPFNAAADAAFEAILARHALPEDKAIRAKVEEAVAKGLAPTAFAWPETRRERTAARIALRRLSVKRSDPQLAAWRAAFDRAPVESDEEAVATGHA